MAPFASLQSPTVGEALLVAASIGLAGVVLGMAYQRRFDHIFGIALFMLSLSLALLAGIIP